MSKAQLRVTLPPGWIDLTQDNPNGGSTYARSSVGLANPLQISFALYKGGKVPNPSTGDLVKLAEGLSKALDNLRLISKNSGSCRFGFYGKAIFEASDCPRAYSWYLSNGQDFIRATYICSIEPEELEIVEVEEIVQTLTLNKK